MNESAMSVSEQTGMVTEFGINGISTYPMSTVPATLPGIVFLSGGQSDEDATAHLNAMNQMGSKPWPLSFSYGRAMQSAALKLWAKDMVGNFAAAQQTVYARAKDNGLAALGRWKG